MTCFYHLKSKPTDESCVDAQSAEMDLIIFMSCGESVITFSHFHLQFYNDFSVWSKRPQMCLIHFFQTCTTTPVFTN